MTNPRHCRVEVKKDHLCKIAASSPKAALAEIIWNSFDADAMNVNVSFTAESARAIKITVADDGAGISYDRVEKLFVSLGGSWKSENQKTDTGRFLHGKAGAGRFKAFALGESVVWKVTGEKEGKLYDFTIIGNGNSLDEFILSSAEESECKSTGVVVEVTKLKSNKALANIPEQAHDLLAPLFAPYLSKYSMVSLNINGRQLEPDALISHREKFSLNPIEVAGHTFPAELDLVEWKTISDQEIWICDARGFPLEALDRDIKEISEFGYTAYLKSDYFLELYKGESLCLGELEQTTQRVKEHATKLIKEYFMSRQLEKAREQIEEWKRDDVYPYAGLPTCQVEEAERQVFDIVAINVSQHLPDFNETNKKSKQFQFRMLRHAIEKSPQDLQKILTEVLNLPKESREQLAELLDDAALSGIINASRAVAERITFVDGLKELLFNHKKHLKERGQLHQLLAQNTWIFGEAFTLSVDNKSLTEVLRKYAEIHKLDMIIDNPVLTLNQRQGIVDLMLSREIPLHKHDEVEHLVVELKRPNVVIGKKDIDQIEDYAFAIARDERFWGLKARWSFWLISNEYDEYAEHKFAEDSHDDGVIFRMSRKLNITIRLKTWSQILQENNHRLHYVREKLNINTDGKKALNHLKDNYAQYINGIQMTGADEGAKD